MSYNSINAEEFEAFMPTFPLMLTNEEHDIEWDALTEIAEATDDPRDWSAVMDYEATCDHQVYEGKW